MRGIAIILLVGLTLYLFKTGWISLTFVTGAAICYLVHTAEGDPVDEIFAGAFYLTAILFAAALLKGVFGAF